MIVTKFNSGLGNQLFQYGASRSLARRTQATICADPWAFSKKLSRNPSNVSTQREFELVKLGFPIFHRKIPSSWLIKIRGYPRFRNWRLDRKRENYLCDGSWDASFESLSGNVVLRGYFQDIRYMGTDLIDIVGEVAKILECPPARQLDGALHVRRGDYLKYPEFYSEWFENYNRLAIKRLESEFGCQRITVFSNDLDWCQQNLSSHRAELQFAAPDFHLGGVRDIIRMSQARVLAIANSTFSWWAAAIATNFGSTVIAPTKWSSFCDTPKKSLYLPNWQILGE